MSDPHPGAEPALAADLRQRVAARADELFDQAISSRAAGDRDAAVRAGQELAKLARSLVRLARNPFASVLAQSLNLLGVVLCEVGRRAEALEAAQEAAELYRELAATNRPAFLPDLAMSLNNLGLRSSEAGRRAEALEAMQEAAGLYRELAAADRPAFLHYLAISLNNMSIGLGEAGRRAEALEAAEEGVGLCRELAAANRPAFLPDLAGILGNFGVRLGEAGRRAEALGAAQEVTGLYRELAAANRLAFLPDLAMSLNNLGGRLSEAGRRAEGLEAAQEAVELCRGLAASNRLAFLPDLAASLTNLGASLSEAGRRAEALEAAQEAAGLHRELAATDRPAFLPDLARSLNNLAAIVSNVGRHAAALESAQEAVGLYRELAAANREAFLPDLVRSLSTLGGSLGASGRRTEALKAFRECGAMLLEWRPSDPHLWTQIARGPTRVLRTAEDLRAWHLPLLHQLAEHRELAYDSTHAELFLALQNEVAARVWDILTTLGPGEAALVDEAIAALVATLQSPDLARWLQAQAVQDGPGGADGNGPGSAAELARLIRAVIDAERVLDALLAQLRHQDGGGPGGFTDKRASGAEPATPDAQARMRREFREWQQAEIARHSAEALKAREAWRAGRKRLIDSDPKLRSTFTLPTAQKLREAAAHTKGQALLCLLDLPDLLNPREVDQESSLKDKPARRIVGALLPADGGPARLLDFPGVDALARRAAEYVPEDAHAKPKRLGTLRGAPATDPAPTTERASAATTDNAEAGPADTPSSFADELAQGLHAHFQAPLQQALREALPATGGRPLRVHLCLHGLTQQLPLALLDEPQGGDGPDLLVWPGLPYLRLAAEPAAVPAADPSTVHAADAPWIVGHDCAWDSALPLPMVAVEAELLVMLLDKFKLPVERIGPQDTIAAQARALVACCHGGVEQPAHFDHALHLGAPPLTAGRIMDEHLGPVLTLLPACFAGRIDEDGAGNALGVCAAFMLSGTRLASGSTKPVPDLLQPWLTTLTVWHLLHGPMTPRQAALKAREQFAKLAFPDEYKHWLQQALPAALATIQRGGQEHRHIRGMWPMQAMQEVRECWPWEGRTEHLFSDDRQLREQATRSVVEGVLVARGGDAGTRKLAAIAREMAAFVAVYGAE